VAQGKIAIIREDALGRVFGYVADSAIEGYASNLLVYFDSRCFAEERTAISIGCRVEFSYDLNNRGSKPRMKFESLRLIGEPDHNEGEN
jgi:hypothetical protein